MHMTRDPRYNELACEIKQLKRISSETSGRQHCQTGAAMLEHAIQIITFSDCQRQYDTNNLRQGQTPNLTGTDHNTILTAVDGRPTLLNKIILLGSYPMAPTISPQLWQVGGSCGGSPPELV